MTTGLEYETTRTAQNQALKRSDADTNTLRYRIIHSTNYDYHDVVNLCHNEAVLTPRTFATPLLEQRCLTSTLQITPRPDDEREHTDFFGNTVHYFALQKPHTSLTVSATSLVERLCYAPSTDDFLSGSEAWERVRERLHSPFADSTGALPPASLLEAVPYRFASLLADVSDDVREYAMVSFFDGRPLLEAVRDLVRRIYEDCEFVPGFTTISTPITEVLAERKGVCQDFAHLALGCLRSLGLAARYVSGYIETLSPEGTERLVGADASHAWIAVFEPHLGWVEFDPTNNQLVRGQHIALGWGRDYADVSPLKGVIMSAAGTELTVSVDVLRQNPF